METKLVRVNDIEMAYFSFGSGKRPFVILPGVSTVSVMRSAMAIRSAYRQFGEEYTVYVFDRRDNMPSPYPVRQMAADTAQVMRTVGISGADIFGASQGGMMALCMAVDAPGLVHGMALGSTTSAVDDTVRRDTRKWVALAESGDMTALTSLMIDELYSEATIAKYKEILVHMNDGISRRDIERFIIQTEAIDGFDLDGELDRITCPALVIGTQGDRVIPPEHSRRLAERLGCELYLYGKEYGHCVFDEAPDYKQRLLDFFHSI